MDEKRVAKYTSAVLTRAALERFVVGGKACEESPARLESHVRTLAGFGTRHTLSVTDDPARGIGAARNWIRATLARCAADNGGRLEVAFDEFTPPTSPRVQTPVPVVNVVAILGFMTLGVTALGLGVGDTWADWRSRARSTLS